MSKSDVFEPRACVTLPVLAAVLGLSARRAQQLAADKVLPELVDGRVVLASAVQSYVQWLRDDARANNASASVSAVQQARAREIEQRIAVNARRLITGEEATSALDEVVGMFVAELDGLPARFSRDRAGRARLQKLTDDIRTRLTARLDQEVIALRAGVEADTASAEGPA